MEQTSHNPLAKAMVVSEDVHIGAVGDRSWLRDGIAQGLSCESDGGRRSDTDNLHTLSSIPFDIVAKIPVSISTQRLSLSLMIVRTTSCLVLIIPSVCCNSPPQP